MSEKTELPTQKKLLDARRKGQVAKSQDFTQTALILALFGYLLASATGLAVGLGEILVLPTQFMHQPFPIALAAVLPRIIDAGVAFLMPFLLIVCAMAIFAEALQVGLHISFEAAKPSLKKLNVVEALKKWFSKKNLVDFLKNCLKVVFLTTLVAWLVRDAIGPLLTVPQAGVDAVGLSIARLVQRMLVYVALVYSVVALADFAWQRLNHRKELMMTKDEVKKEFKESEGDPHLKQHRKQIAQEIALGTQVEATRKATAVITNPTHLAIAIRYDDDETPLPLLLAKGEGALAARMVSVAREEGIPVLQNIPLARALFERGAVDHFIPVELIEPVAAVLGEIRAMAERQRGAS